MSDYSTERDRRVTQFESYLTKMNERAHDIAHGPCFIIFSENWESDAEVDGELRESSELEQVKVSEISTAEEGIGTVLFGESIGATAPNCDWRQDAPRYRFVQFSFEQNWFCLDMPAETLSRAEARRILRDRLGFFYLCDRTEFTLHEEDVKGFDPFRKIYVYGDERSAADDMAHIFFSVWNFPVDSRLYVTSSAFSGQHNWERGWPID